MLIFLIDLFRLTISFQFKHWCAAENVIKKKKKNWNMFEILTNENWLARRSYDLPFCG